MAIHIKKKNVGKFTAYKKRTGKTTAEALHSKNPHVRAMANFSRNAKKWKHPYGGPIGQPDNTVVTNNLWSPQTRSSIYPLLAQKGLLGHGTDSVTMQQWNQLTPQQTTSYMQQGQGFDWTQGNTANPGGVKYWNLDKVPVVNGQSIRTSKFSDKYYKEKKNTKYRKGGFVPEYGIGGDVLSGAGAGMALGPWGAVAGGALGLVTGLLNQNANKGDGQARNYALQQAQQGQASISNSLFPPTFAMGGQINAEIEKQEVVVPPNGIQAGVRRKYNLPTHKNATGANLVSAQPGSFVVSDRLMYDDTKTMAQAYEEAGKKVDKYQAILDNPKSTSLAIKTSQRNIDNIKKLQQDIVNKNQAMLSQQVGMVDEKGIPKAPLGGLLEGDLFAANPGLGAAFSLAPVAANLIGGLSGVDKLNPNEYMNPYAGTAVFQMDNRRFNTGPALAANANASAAAMGNVVNQGGGRGQVNANRQALLSARMMGDASVYAQAQNANNEYAGQAAQFKAGIGQQMANTRMQVKDINDRNRAARTAMLTTAAGQLGQFGQTQQLMANQKTRDADMMTRWQDYLDMMKTGKVPVNNGVTPQDYQIPSGGYYNTPGYNNNNRG